MRHHTHRHGRSPSHSLSQALQQCDMVSYCHTLCHGLYLGHRQYFSQNIPGPPNTTGIVMYCYTHCHTLSQCLTDSETKWLGLNPATHSPTWSLTLSHTVPTSQLHTARSLGHRHSHTVWSNSHSDPRPYSHIRPTPTVTHTATAFPSYTV